MVDLAWIGPHSLSEVNIKQHVENKAGVYRLEPMSSSDPFYVGQASDLVARLTSHLKESEKDSCIKRKHAEGLVFFRCAYVARQEDRDCIERFMFDLFKGRKQAECNTRAPDVRPCPVNL